MFSTQQATGDAIQLIEDVSRLSADTQDLLLRGDILETRGEVLGAAGRLEEANASFSEALALYDRKGNVAAAVNLRARRTRSAERTASRSP